MATIAENLSLLQQTKNDIKTAIESKGQDLTSVPFTQYANKITNIGNETQVSDEIVYSDVDNGNEISITLSQLQQAKNDIKTAIENKGQDLTNIPFTGYANKIMNIVIEQEPSGTVGLVYSGLDSNGNITTDETAIVAYMIGDNTTTNGNGYTGTETDVIIPPTYNDKPITQIGKYAFSGKTEITSVSIPKSVKIINHNAFSSCSGLVEIKFSEGLIRIGNSSFANCTGLTSIEIPSSVTTIDHYAFTRCSELKSINVADYNTAYKDDNGRALLTIDGKTLLVYAYKSGSTYVIPYGVTTIGRSAFRNCTSLNSIEIPSSVTSIEENAFYDCKNATINFTDGTIISRLVGGVFYGFEGIITGLVLGNGITNIDAVAFQNCTGLNSIEIPSTITSIGFMAFANCSNLTEMTLLPTTPPTLASLAISSATTVIYVPYESLEAYQMATNWSNFADIMVGFGEPQATEGLVYSGLDESGVITTDETLIVSYMIGDNTSTYGNGYVGTDTDVIIPSIYNEKPVIKIGRNAFRDKTELTSVNIPESVTAIGAYAFQGCALLTSINIPKNVKTIDSATFKECSNLTLIILPEGLTRINNTAFNGCSSLTSIEIPASVTTISSYIFKGCISLTSITVEEGNTAYKDDNGRALLTIDGKNLYAYANLSGTSYIIPEGVEKISTYAFYDCDNLTSIEIPEGVSEFGTYAFYGTGLKSIELPESLTKLSTNIFNGCLSLTKMTLNATTPPTLADTNAISTATTTIYVPTASLEAYQTATNWSEFADIMVGFGVPQATEGLVYTGLSIFGSILDDEYESQAVEYMIGNDSTVHSNGYNGANTEIVIPSTYKGKPVTTIGPHAFASNSTITSVYIPESITVIKNDAFSLCSSLTSINLPEGLTTIEERTFSSCSSLTKITIPSTVIEIKTFGLSTDSALEITMLSKTPPILSSISSIADSTTTINIPSGTYEAYSSATNWRAFATILNDPAHIPGTKSWKTVWTGNLNITRSLTTYADVEGITITEGLPVRVSGSAYSAGTTFTNIEVGSTNTFVVNDTHDQYMRVEGSRLVGYVKGQLVVKGIILNEVQQYY